MRLTCDEQGVEYNGEEEQRASGRKWPAGRGWRGGTMWQGIWRRRNVASAQEICRPLRMDPSVHPHGAPSAGRADPTPFTCDKRLKLKLIFKKKIPAKIPPSGRIQTPPGGHGHLRVSWGRQRWWHLIRIAAVLGDQRHPLRPLDWNYRSAGQCAGYQAHYARHLALFRNHFFILAAQWDGHWRCDAKRRLLIGVVVWWPVKRLTWDAAVIRPFRFVFRRIFKLKWTHVDPLLEWIWSRSTGWLILCKISLKILLKFIETAEMVKISSQFNLRWF